MLSAAEVVAQRKAEKHFLLFFSVKLRVSSVHLRVTSLLQPSISCVGVGGELLGFGNDGGGLAQFT